MSQTPARERLRLVWIEPCQVERRNCLRIHRIGTMHRLSAQLGAGFLGEASNCDRATPLAWLVIRQSDSSGVACVSQYGWYFNIPIFQGPLTSYSTPRQLTQRSRQAETSATK